MVSSIIMQIRDFLQLVAQLPGWLLYFGVPALLVVTGLILAVVMPTAPIRPSRSF